MLANDGDLKDQIKPFSQLTSYWKTAPVKQLFQAVWLQLLQVGSLAAVGLKNVLVKHASRPPPAPCSARVLSHAMAVPV